MDLAEIKIYRMTHLDNIEHILQNGITHRNLPLVVIMMSQKTS